MSTPTPVGRADLDKAARALYDACPTPKPTWEQLGDGTKSVWHGYVLAGTLLSHTKEDT